MPMFQFRIHGRGGQGVVTAAEMLSIAAFAEGKHSQAFPSFGSERMGAPVVSYVRIDDAPVELTEPVMEPDLLIVQDPTLFHAVDVFAGLGPDGFVLINSARSVAELGIETVAARLPEGHVATVAATELAIRHIGRPTPNTVLLGALTAFTDVIHLESVFQAIRDKFAGDVAERNVAAAQAAHDQARPV
jgi:pyruvate ferredoxin oxidoreductase gamma subunit